MNPFDRLVNNIEVAVACYRGQREFERELRAKDRAAGAKKNNTGDTNPVSNNTVTAEPSTTIVNVTNTGSNETIKNPPIKEEPKPEETVQQNDNTENQNTVVETTKTEEEVRQDQLAESQAPAEEPGAEKIVAQTDVTKPAEAAMAGYTHNAGNDSSGVLDFSAFCPGMKIDLRNPGIDDVVQEHQSPNIEAQFPVNAFPGMNVYTPMVNGGNTNPPLIHRHRVDEPKVEKPVKPPKAEPDVVDMGGMPNMGKVIQLQPPVERFDVRTYGVLQESVPKEVDQNAIKPVSIFPANANLYKDHPYLEEIEKIALSNGYQIAFAKQRGLIGCVVCKQTGEPIAGKAFTIDTGYIIDHREKIFIGINPFYEGMNAYPLMIDNRTNGDKKSPKTLNIEFISKLIIAGNQFANGVKGMYSQDFIDLNSIIPLITIPTKNIDRNNRKYIQNRLVGLYKDGTLSNIAAQHPNNRFRIAHYDPNSGTIILDSCGVPKHYGDGVFPDDKIQIKITKDKFKVLYGENVIDLDSIGNSENN